MIAAAYGAGTNSTAMKRGERPDVINFADTGGERPEVYDFVVLFSAWLVDRGFPAIVTVQTQDREGNFYTLEQRCLDRKMLPSIAYGRKACSEKHKQRPQHKYLRANEDALVVWAAGERVEKWIGYDLDERHRAEGAPLDDPHYAFRYPLIEWGMGRDECVESIRAAGLPQPGKSACFFCPNSSEREIFALKREHPDLLARALHMEANAELHTIKGLGRGRWSWADLLRADEAQLPMFAGGQGEMPCGCYDGDAE